MKKNFNIEVKLAKENGRGIVANAKVTSGVLTSRFNLVEKEGVLYLNSPSRFVKSLKSETNNGFINQSWIEKETAEAVRDEIIAKYKELQQAA